MLHDDKELFEQAVLKTAEYMNIDVGIVEKDYYVTLMLKELAETVPDLVFKGGTSLSKCHKIINRFSEDIDLTIEYDTKPSESKRKNLKKCIAAAIEKHGFELANPNEIRSRRDFNKYVVNYPSAFTQNGLKNHLQIETMIKIKAYPNKEMEAASFIYDYLEAKGFHDMIKEHGLEPFILKVQSAGRTFVDKVFALADYYMSGRITEHSRHIYDLYKLMDKVELNQDLKDLFEQVRQERKPHQSICLSAQNDVNINEVLTEMIEKAVYKSDYNEITALLIFEKLEYETAIKALNEVKDFLKN